jgi:ATP phosphoribosyltransferase regulatory subunit
VLALIVEALRETGLDHYQLRIGDLGLFSALLDALPLPRRWRRRLHHHFWRPEAFRAELARLTSRSALQPRGVPGALVERLDPDRPEEAVGLVAEHLDREGLELLGTRTLSEIAERVLAEVADAREPPLAPQTAALIESYVAVKTPAGEAARRLEGLLRPHKVDLEPALARFRRRLELIEAGGVSTAEAAFSAEFGRNLEYYTGFVFEIAVPRLGPRSPIAGGGRYDSLLADVGAASAVPAVGSCIHTERLLTALSGEAP